MVAEHEVITRISNDRIAGCPTEDDIVARAGVDRVWTADRRSSCRDVVDVVVCLRG